MSSTTAPTSPDGIADVRERAAVMSPGPVHRLARFRFWSRPEPRDRFMTVQELLIEFESLGDNCEFGLVQRYGGVEPLGLFRFSFSRLPNLLAVFATRFADYGTDQDMDMSINPGDSEFVCRSRKYKDFMTHTERFATNTTIEKVRDRELTKMVYLKERLLEQLGAGEKIFVRKQNHVERFEDIKTLGKALRKHGPNILFWVVEADEDHAPGHVEKVGPGLIKGYMSRFAPYDVATDIDVGTWIALCRGAFQVARGMRRQYENLARFPTNPVLAEGYDLEALEGSELVENCKDIPRLFRHRPVTRLALPRSNVETWLAIKRLADVMEERATVTFSVWLWIPSSFRGTLASVLLGSGDFQNHFNGVADLSRRDLWQQVWCSMKVSKPIDQLNGVVRARGEKGSTIYCTAWRFERGWVPNAVMPQTSDDESEV